MAGFDTDSPIPPERMAYALNQKLPEDIVIVRSDEVPGDWHPRYQDHVRKTYEYHIYNASVPNPLKRRYNTFVSFPMDVEKMRQGAAYLTGEHDFASFCSVGSQAETTVRTIYELDVARDGEEIIIRVTGNGFLYNMVRIMTGALIDVGHKKIAPEDIKIMLEEKDRTKAADTASAKGLYLYKVSY